MKTIFSKIFLTAIFTFVFATSVYATEYYISPSGNDSLDGSTAGNAIATFVHAYTIMSPGDTLTLLDGLYDEQLYPPNGLSGSAGNYTTFRAENVGQAVIAPSSEDQLSDVGGATASLFFYSNADSQASYFHIDGLFVKGIGEHSAIDVRGRDFATSAQMTHHIRITRTGAQGSALDRNVVAFGITMSRNILIEDCYSFGPSRKPMQVFGSDNLTLRRIVLRFDWWEGDSYKPGDPRTSMSVYNTTNSILENIIVIDAGKRPAGVNSDKAALSVGGNETPVTDNDSSSNIKYLGSIAYNNLENSVGVNVNGGSGSPNANVEFRDIVIWNSGNYGVNIHANVHGVNLVNITTSHHLSSGIRLNPYPGNGDITDVSISNSVSVDNEGYGFYYRESANQITTFVNNTAARNDRGNDVETEYEPAITHLPTNTPVAGHPRGAIIENRYVDGVLTGDPLWPYPNEDLIKLRMCDPIFLQKLSAIINAKDGTNISYLPGFCATSGTLTEYLWEALGNDCPAGVCDDNRARISEVTPILTPTTNRTPSYVFNASRLGGGTATADWTGSCEGYFPETVDEIKLGTNTVTANPMPVGVYSNCALRVNDGNTFSNTLFIPPFTISNSAPTPSHDILCFPVKTKEGRVTLVCL